MGKSIVEYTFKDCGDVRCSPGGVFLGCCCSTVLIVLIILFFPATVIQLGQKNYGLARNKVTGVVDLEQTYVPGRYWLGFWRDFLEFPSTLNTIEFSDEKPEEGVQQLSILRSRDQDGKQIYLDVSVQYKLKESGIGMLYKEYNLLFENVYVSALRDALSKAGNQFKIADVWEDYQRVNNMMKQACIDVMKPRHAECWDLQLWRVRLDTRYEAALIRTQVRKQAQETEKARSMHSYVRAKTQVILAEYRANVTKLDAVGTSSKYEIEREAEATAAASVVNATATLLREIAKTVTVRSSGLPMNETELVNYKRLMMLQEQQKAHMVYHSNGDGYTEARNVQAMRAISTRRLTPQEL